jgi:hypothetical protein
MVEQHLWITESSAKPVGGIKTATKKWFMAVLMVDWLM